MVTPETTLAGGERWDTQYGEDHLGAARIRRRVLANTIDGMDPYEKAFDAMRLSGYEAILDAGCDDADDILNLRIERNHLGPLIAMDIPPQDLTLAGIQNDNRFVVARELISRNKDEIKNISFLYGYLQALPLPDNFVRRYMSLWSTIHVPPEELSAAIGEAERVTAPMGYVIYGSNAYGHTPRKHQIVSEIGEILDVQTPEPFSSHFKIEDVPAIVTSRSNLIHLPHKRIFQDTMLALNRYNLDGFIHMVNTYKNSCWPIPTASEWNAALYQSEELRKIQREIDQNGVAFEPVRRGVEFFVKPR